MNIRTPFKMIIYLFFYLFLWFASDKKLWRNSNCNWFLKLSAGYNYASLWKNEVPLPSECQQLLSDLGSIVFKEVGFNSNEIATFVSRIPDYIARI